MIDSSKAGLAYFEKNFSPFQFRQYRILEYPRYRTFAQSFPNTIPFSEGIGFIGRVEKPTDIDFAYFVTAHELGHQWWAHQLIGGRVEGSNMMSETLAEYSALMVMQQKYGRDNMHRFLKHELDRYLRGRAGEIRRERPVVLVQNEPYVWYQKGGQVMYTLADYIGEDKVNLALHNFLMQYRYANANDDRNPARTPTPASCSRPSAPKLPPTSSTTSPTPSRTSSSTTTKPSPPPSRPPPITNTKSPSPYRSASSRPTAAASRLAMPLHDFIDIGVFNGKKDEEKPLYLKKMWLTQPTQTFEIIVDQPPTRAGIDPFNKLIDRDSDDNWMAVSKP